MKKTEPFVSNGKPCRPGKFRGSRRFLSGFLLLSALLTGFAILSCAQDHIFFTLSIDPEPVEPLIPGGPCNIVQVAGKIYAATRWDDTIFEYNGQSWRTIPLPGGGSIGELASDGTSLYVLFFPTGDPYEYTRIKKYEGSAWSPSNVLQDPAVENNWRIHTIYGANGKIFAGAAHKDDKNHYAILYYDPLSPGEPLAVIGAGASGRGGSLLKGAAGLNGHVYLAMSRSGILKFDSVNGIPEETTGDSENTVWKPLLGTDAKNMVGIISTGTKIVAVSSDGDGNGSVFVSSEDGNSFTSHQESVIFTGAMCVWKNYVAGEDPSWKPSLLLIGIQGQGTSTSHGYRELSIDSLSSGVRKPGIAPTSVNNEDSFDVSIGKHPVNSILQVPPDLYPDYASSKLAGDSAWRPPVFASTQKDGLWSCRNGEWNAEN